MNEARHRMPPQLAGSEQPGAVVRSRPPRRNPRPATGSAVVAEHPVRTTNRPAGRGYGNGTRGGVWIAHHPAARVPLGTFRVRRADAHQRVVRQPDKRRSRPGAPVVSHTRRPADRMVTAAPARMIGIRRSCGCYADMAAVPASSRTPRAAGRSANNSPYCSRSRGLE